MSVRDCSPRQTLGRMFGSFCCICEDAKSTKAGTSMANDLLYFLTGHGRQSRLHQRAAGAHKRSPMPRLVGS